MIQTTFEYQELPDKLRMVSSTLLSLRLSVRDGFDDMEAITQCLDVIAHLLEEIIRGMQTTGEKEG